MGSTLQQIRSRLGTRGIAATAALLVALVVAVATPEILGTRVAAAFGALDNADPKWLWLAGIGFSLAVISAARSPRLPRRHPGPRLLVPRHPHLRRDDHPHRRLRPLRRRLPRQHLHPRPRRRRRP